MPELTVERARELFSYDPDTGILTRKSCRGSKKTGEPAGHMKDKPGSKNATKYLLVGIDYRHYYVHRIAWLIANGSWPTGQIDHINGDQSDNRLSNLREADTRANQENCRRPHKDNPTKHLGVSKVSRGGRFRADIQVNGKQMYLGTYQSPAEAHQAYLTAKRQLHAGCTI